MAGTVTFHFDDGSLSHYEQAYPVFRKHGVPQRGARLGNFGVCHVSERESKVVVTEWMQPKGCEAYGSDNALWVTDIRM